MLDQLRDERLPRQGTDRHPNVIQELLGELHASFSGVREGRVADYIPELAKACPDDFGIVIATSGGRIYEIGDTRKEFTIQSISKPFIYALALKTLSFDFMASKIDVEPSGEAFNAISLDPDSGKPRNPMINAGAIAASAQICDADPSGAVELLLEYFGELAGRRLTINEDVYRSEKETGHRNRAIGHLLRNFNIIESDPEPALDLYFQQCAISVTCHDLAVMASTLACQGRNPFTGGHPLSYDITVRVLALMGTCGMYDFAGQWLHDVGIPAKSGVAGGVMAVIPGRLGIATYSPPLDNFGNSVRGVAVCRQLSVGVGLSLFNQYSQADATIRRSYQGSQRKSRRWRSERELEILAPHRDEVRIIHVQGVLDFGGIEQLASELVRLSNDVRILILDLAHVTECPMESSGLLDRQLCSIEDDGVEILLSRAGRLPLVSKTDWSITDRIDAYEHLDSALEAAEELLLSWYRPQAVAGGSDGGPDLPEQGFLAPLSEEHRRLLAECMVRRAFVAGDFVIRRGDPGDELFLVRSGSFDIALDIKTGDGHCHSTRLATFGPGLCFGEIGFVAQTPRTADIIATQPGECWVLHRSDFEALSASHPDVVIALLKALTCDIGAKLSQTSVQLTLMEHY
ncbi:MULTISPECIES: glutaminase A [unclassified Cyanobium]|uniref:glutaminase A n=1 Tax=unclassified Cyanobium TaxID=2627006 RepID=UPI0020CFC3C6|nr:MULTISPECIES: glutaminase A [unclassified Cyanobium]MCP9834000.1 glutaminase A [Cyanobium sp. La Preciosa 7G6]MCP9936763.1 glutaminase A [Cyanobium sp. Aljojuca 7A6]